MLLLHIVVSGCRFMEINSQYLRGGDITMRVSSVMVLFSVIVLLAGSIQAQDAAQPSAEQQAMMEAWTKAMTPGPQHAAMAKMAGEFNLTVKSYMEPGAEPMVSTATATRKLILGGRYLEEAVHGSFMGQPFEGRGLTGYDNASERWWGTWVDNMSTGLMTSSGEWDEESGIGMFWGENTDPMTGEQQKSRTVMKRLANGDELMESFVVSSEGEFKSMEILYERK